jgi:hypothetical protein
VFSFVVHSFSKLAILIHFEMNRDYIAKNLCVKKKVASNCCKGSCQLNKQLLEQEKKDKQSPLQSIKNKAELSYFLNSKKIDFILTQTIEKKIFSFLFPKLITPMRAVFQPPELVTYSNII